MRIGALIPARAGSKRIPQKNIKLFNGKPLICRTVDVLLESDMFDNVTVSTESSKVEATIREYYPEKEVAVLRRPDKLAHDDAPLTSVIMHYLDSSPKVDWVGLFMPTYPFRKVEKLHEAQCYIRTRYPWRVASTSEELISTMDFYYPGDGGMRNFFRDPPMILGYHTSTYMFWNRHCVDKMWIDLGLTINERVAYVNCSRQETLDLDYPDEFDFAEKIAASGIFKIRPQVEYDIGEWMLVAPEGTDPDKVVDYIGAEKLSERTEPILFLAAPNPVVTMLRTADYLGSRTYWVDARTCDYLNSTKVQSTQNSRHMGQHYLHSRYYRLLHKTGIDSPLSNNFSQPGVLVGAGSEKTISKPPVPMDRVVYMEDFVRTGAYRFPYETNGKGE